MIRRYFKTFEIIHLLTSKFYSKLYYGSEIWHLLTLNSHCKKLLLSTSVNALKLCNAIHYPNISYVDLHKLHKKALPNNFCTYRHCLLLFKVFNNKIFERDWLNLNFQMINTRRTTLFEVQNCSVYKVGNNILSNRLSCLNRKLQLESLTTSFEMYKITCKGLFLLWTGISNLKHVVCSVVNFIKLIYFYVLSVMMLNLHWRRNNKSFLKPNKKLESTHSGLSVIIIFEKILFDMTQKFSHFCSMVQGNLWPL
jgi:hypothetical protein